MTRRDRLDAYIKAMREKPVQNTMNCRVCPDHYHHPDHLGATWKYGAKVRPGKHYCRKFGKTVRIDGRMLGDKYRCTDKIIQ